MKTQFLNSPDDCQWLRETALKPANLNGATLPAFESFELTGNEDCPQVIRLHRVTEPDYRATPVAVATLREDLTYDLAITDPEVIAAEITYLEQLRAEENFRCGKS